MLGYGSVGPNTGRGNEDEPRRAAGDASGHDDRRRRRPGKSVEAFPSRCLYIQSLLMSFESHAFMPGPSRLCVLGRSCRDLAR